jgi:hypothetical protein
MYDITNHSYVCAATTPVCVAGETRTAREWAAIHGIKWQALKMRRYRGMDWSDAFAQLRRGRKPTQRAA